MNRKEKIQVGIFGVGKFGTRHLENWLAIPEVSVVGFCDIDPEKQKIIPEKYGIPHFFHDALIERCDIADIVVPTISHYEIAKKALQAGKHTFVEKPFTETVEQAKELLSLANNQKGPFLTVGFIERFNPIFKKVLEVFPLNPVFIESHRLGQFNPYRGTDVPVVMELLIHDIDILLHIVQSPIEAIHASGSPVLSSQTDIVNARIEFKNGTVANLTSSRISPKKMRKMRFFQPNGYASVDFLNQTADLYQLQKNEGDLSKDSERIMVTIPEDFEKGFRYQNLSTKKENALQAELREFARSCLKEIPPIVSGLDGYKALQLAIDIQNAVMIHHNKFTSTP
ncbi:MAG: Gfo/Idh/MocA family oxidoreductase [Candidatus Marinimicrobia bacterium]|nr:Gfo/Idh/MocA family oxidoreductase [Candidatus Neomarinimicrobiota bacterium]